jgi:hypothetical protein
MKGVIVKSYRGNRFARIYTERSRKEVGKRDEIMNSDRASTLHDDGGNIDIGLDALVG